MKRLCVFDFDGSLFRSPENTEENKKIYEKATGIPWLITKNMAVQLSKKLNRTINPRSGWWGKAETLMPPLVPDPIPQEMWIKETVKSLQKCRSDQDTVTIIMTGRHTGLKHQVLRILYDGNFCIIDKTQKKNSEWHYEWADSSVSLYLLGMDGPCPEMTGAKPGDTFAWKTWIINQYRLLYPNLEHIEIWEDRIEHVDKFTELNNKFQEKVTVHHVK